MEQEVKQLAQGNLEEMTAFCFRKLATLEAKFILLCYRAEKAGIDCADLRTVEVSMEVVEAETGSMAGPALH